jgi:HEAT repeat protein
VALGITGSSAAAPELRKRLRAETTTAVRCQVALALALTGAADAAEELRPLLVAKGVDPQLRWHAARGLGVLRDREAAPLLISTLRESTTLIEVVAAASALGQLRDRTAVQPLLDLVSDRRQAPARRGFAIVALGMLGDSDRLPWNSVFTVGSNWLADGPALAEIRDLL